MIFMFIDGCWYNATGKFDWMFNPDLDDIYIGY